MFLEPTEVDVEVVGWGKELAEGAVLGELREGVDVFRKALARRLAASSGIRYANAFPSKTHPRFLRRMSAASLAVGPPRM